MFQIVTSTRFLKDLKLLKKRSVKDFHSLKEIVAVLEEKGHTGIDSKNKAHKLTVFIRDIGNVMSSRIYYSFGLKILNKTFSNWYEPQPILIYFRI